jgi:cold shock CspA family protein
MKTIGKVWAVSERGFAFVEEDDSHRNIFIHFKRFKDSRIPHVGDTVQFELSPSQKYAGRWDGFDAEIVGRGGQ